MNEQNIPVAIYWGAFNPPTIGHKQIIEWVIGNKIVDKIIFTPDGERKDKDYGIENERRRDIIEIFYEELKTLLWDKIDISRHFLKEKESELTSTKSVNTHFTDKLWFSPYHIFWSDTVIGMDTWINNEDRYIQEVLAKIFITRKWYNPNMSQIDNYHLVTIDEVWDVSSTMVRRMIKRKQEISNLLTSSVNEYIKENTITYNT